MGCRGRRRGAHANPRGHWSPLSTLFPSPPLANPCAKPPVIGQYHLPQDPSLLLSSYFLLFCLLFILLFNFPKLESLWLQGKETCYQGRMGVGRGTAAPHGPCLSGLMLLHGEGLLTGPSDGFMTWPP